MRVFVLALLLAFGITAHARADNWLIPATVIEVYDGDTIRVAAEPWPDHTVRVSVRVDGIDTPEIRGAKCESELARALEAKAFLEAAVGETITLRSPKHGKFAKRIVAMVTTEDGRDVTTLMIEAGHARPYGGGSRAGWCD